MMPLRSSSRPLSFLGAGKESYNAQTKRIVDFVAFQRSRREQFHLFRVVVDNPSYCFHRLHSAILVDLHAVPHLITYLLSAQALVRTKSSSYIGMLVQLRLIPAAKLTTAGRASAYPSTRRATCSTTTSHQTLPSAHSRNSSLPKPASPPHLKDSGSTVNPSPLIHKHSAPRA